MATLKMFNRDVSRGEEMEEANEVQRKVTMKLLAVAQSQFIFLELGLRLVLNSRGDGGRSLSLYRRLFNAW